MTICSDVLTATRQHGVTVRAGRPEDHPTIARLVRDAYSQYEAAMPSEAWSRFLRDLLDLDRHTSLGLLVVAEVDGVVRGSATFYPDSSIQGFGWPVGWAGGRGLAVHPAARGRGVATALLAELECRARSVCADEFAFHTAEFMTTAVALYERLGYRRAPQFDLDLNHHFDIHDSAPVRALAYRRALKGMAA